MDTEALGVVKQQQNYSAKDLQNCKKPTMPIKVKISKKYCSI